MIYRVLGDLRIGPEDVPVPLPGGRTLHLLALLLLNPNRVLSQQMLIGRLWDDAATTVPRTAQTQLYKHVGEVRRLLEPVHRQHDLVKHRGRGYELKVAEQDLDSLVFIRLLTRAGTTNDGQQRIEMLEQALELWRGPRPLPGLSADNTHAQNDLVNRRKRAILQLVDLRDEIHQDESGLEHLEHAVQDYPADTPLCRRLMRAYLRAGRHSDALDAFSRHADLLEDCFAQRPPRDLRDLAYAVARRDDREISRAIGHVPTRSEVPQQLPPPVDLFGRDGSFAEVVMLLSRGTGPFVRTVLITGAPGSGKTALAVRAAHEVLPRYPDGQLWARLRSTDGSPVPAFEILGEFLRALGVSRVPERESERITSYRTLTAQRRILVLLDDAGDEQQIGSLIPGGSGNGVIVTARQRFPLLEQVHHIGALEPLPRRPAAALFRQVATDAGITLPPEENDAVDRVVQLCDGLPLALRIAGALRVRDHPRSTQVLAARLERQGNQGFTIGSLSVERTISASLAGLPAPALNLFRQLGSTRLPEFPAWTAEVLVTGAEGEPELALSLLAANFLIEPLRGAHRYRMHELTRDHARRAPDQQTAQAAALVYGALLTLARHAHRQMYGGDYEVVHSTVRDWAAPGDLLALVAGDPLGWFEQERANLRAAIEHCCVLGLTEIAWDLAVTCHEFYAIRAYFDDWHATHTQALAACQDVGDLRGTGILLTCLGQPTLVAGHGSHDVSGAPELRRALALLNRCGDTHGAAIAQRTLGSVLRRTGLLTEALQMFSSALPAYGDSGDLVGQQQTLRLIGQTHLNQDRPEEAIGWLARARVVAQKVGDRRLIAQSDYWMGQAELHLGNLDRADRSFTRVDAAFASGLGRAYALHGLGQVALAGGRPDRAETLLAEAADLARGLDDLLEGRILTSLAACDRARGQSLPERERLTQAAAIFAACDAVHLQIRALIGLAAAASAVADAVAASEHLAQVEQIYRSSEIPDDDRVSRASAAVRA